MHPMNVTPWTATCQAPLSMGFIQQVYWSGLPFLSPGDLLDPGIEPPSPALTGGFFTTEPAGKPVDNTRETHTHTHTKRSTWL